MIKEIYLTLPVANVPKSMAFFKALGFSHKFADDSVACIAMSETIFVMLGTHEKFVELSPKPVCDPSRAEVLIALSCESRAQVDDLVAKARAAGGAIHEESVDYGFMYHGSFADPDGHLWGLNYMSSPPPHDGTCASPEKET